MEKYIGFKLNEAEPMNLGEYNKMRGWLIPKDEDPQRQGYKVVYVDGYVSWSPKEVFEKSYMRIGENNTITQENVDNFIDTIEFSKWEDKTTVAHAKLVNGFIISESSSCVDSSNFNMEIGVEICRDKIKDKVWNLLGFLLQTAKQGIK